MDESQTPFARECAARGWGRSSAFLRAFDATADLLGEHVALTDRQFRRWRCPHPPRPRPRAWRVLHAMFGVSPLELGFPGPEPSATLDGLPGRYEGVHVERRAFVADSVGSAAGLAMGSRGTVGTPHVVELREGLRSLFAFDNAHGGNSIRSLAARHLRRVRRIINTGTYPATIGRQLQHVAGESEELCAWFSYDAEDQETARRYWGEALTTATMLRDDNLEAMALAMLSLQASSEERPRDAYELAHAARQRATPLGSPRLLSVIATREARALTLMRDHSGARKRLAEAMRLVDQSDRERPAPEWTAFHGHAELNYWQATLYSASDKHKAAVPFLRAAISQGDGTYSRNQALDRLALARTLVQAGEVDEGASEALASLEHLTEVESGRVTRSLHEVRALLSEADAVSAKDAAEGLTAYTEGEL
ncbi:hypothetical protein ACFZCY_23955 [Streptomyces sp. NPDC007983]|uniref:hypothetical protein n=1 Tax=Streptomyces sp. NPDC007983 TaxID=3364800 RepID=UPI0036EA39DD